MISPDFDTQDTHKVIVITIVCSHKLGDQSNIWEELKGTISDEINQLAHHQDVNDIAFALNVFNEGKKVPMCKSVRERKTGDQVWSQWIADYDMTKLQDCKTCTLLM